MTSRHRHVTDGDEAVILLQFVGAAVCFASDLVLWSFPMSAPCVTAVADAAAGPLADADADDS